MYPLNMIYMIYYIHVYLIIQISQLSSMNAMGFLLDNVKPASNDNNTAPKSERKLSGDPKQDGRKTPKKNKNELHAYQSAIKSTGKQPIDNKKYSSEIKNPLQKVRSKSSLKKNFSNSQKSVVKQFTQPSLQVKQEDQVQKEFLLVVTIESIRPLTNIQTDKNKVQHKLSIQVGNKDALKEFDASQINLLNWKTIFPAKESNNITVKLVNRKKVEELKEIQKGSQKQTVKVTKHIKVDVAFTKIPLAKFFKFQGVRHSLTVDLADAVSFNQKIVKKFGTMNMEFLILKQKVGKLRIQELELILNESTDYLKSKNLHIQIVTDDSAHVITTKPNSTSQSGIAKWRDIDAVPIDSIRSKLMFKVYSTGALGTSLLSQTIFDPYKKQLFQEGNSRELYELIMEITEKKRFRLLVKGKFNQSKEIEFFQ